MIVPIPVIVGVLVIVLVLSGLAFRPRGVVAPEDAEIQHKKLKHEADLHQKERDSIAEEANKAKAELQIIYDVARSLGASTHLAETLQIVGSMIRRLRIPYQSLVLFLVQGEEFEVGLAERRGTEPVNLQHLMLLRAVRDGRASLIESLTDDPLFPEEQSVLLVPLRLRNETVGLIYLGSLRAGTHKVEHLEKVKTLAALAAPSLKTALLFGKQAELLESERENRAAVEAKNRQLGGLQKLGAAIGTSLKLGDTQRAVADNLRVMIPTTQSVVFFGVGENGLCKVDYANSPYTDYLNSLGLRPDEGVLSRASHYSETILEDTPRNNRILHNEACCMVTALRAEGELLGFLYLGAVREGDFNEEHRQLVTTVAYQTAVAANNARLYERTQLMASTDGLTGLYLHRFFQVRLAEEIARAERQGKTLCLVMVDTDHFKTFNDTLGHPAGDALLKEIATLLKDKVRHTDIVCRYGGDEFALILKDVPKDEAARTCERIRETFQLRFANVAVQVTASIGLACYPSDARSKVDLARVADEALYVSKRGGRNRVTVAPPLVS